MKPRRAVHAVGIEQRERGIAERRRALDERFGQRGALQKAERRRGVEFDVHGSGVRWSELAGVDSIDNSVDEPSLRVARAEQPIRRAIGQRHVPLVAIPWPGSGWDGIGDRAIRDPDP